MKLTPDVAEFRSQTELSHTPRSVEFVLTDQNDAKHLFHVPQLYDEITKATFKYAPEKNRITISLRKKTEFTWSNLRRNK